MAYHLVGAIGKFSSIGAPTFGQATTAGNLLVAWVGSNSSATTDPFVCSTSGWKSAVASGGAYNWSSIWYKYNCTADETSPTFTVTGSNVICSQLAEFSGSGSSDPIDKSGAASPGGQAVTVTATAADSAGDDLIVATAFWNGSNALNLTSTTITDGTHSSVSVTNYFNSPTTGLGCNNFFGISGASGPDADVASTATASFDGSCGCLASFKTSAPSVSGSSSDVASLQDNATALGVVGASDAVLMSDSPVGLGISPIIFQYQASASLSVKSGQISYAKNCVLAVSATQLSAASNFTITDTNGLTWTAIGPVKEDGTRCSWTWYAIAPKDGNTSITLTSADSGPWNWDIGVVPSGGTVIQTANGDGADPYALSFGAVPNPTSLILVSWYCDSDAPSPSITGFTALGSSDYNSVVGDCHEMFYKAGNGSQSVTMNAAGASGHGDFLQLLEITPLVVGPPTTSDNLPLSDSSVSEVALERAGSDSLPLTDGVTGIIAAQSTANDGLPFSDVVTDVIETPRMAAESLSLVDAASRHAEMHRTASDPLSLADALSRRATEARTASESFSLSDLLSRAGTQGRVASDPLSLADALSRYTTEARRTADGIVMSDLVGRVLVFSRRSEDGLSLADGTSESVVLARVTTDSLSVVDQSAGSVGAHDGNDELTVADANSHVGDVARQAAETFVVSESGTRAVGLVRASFDSTLLGDGASRSPRLTRIGTEILGVGDVTSVATGTIRRATDTVGFGDSVGAVLGLFASDRMSASDQSGVGPVTEDLFPFYDAAVWLAPVVELGIVVYASRFARSISTQATSRALEVPATSRTLEVVGSP